LRSSAAGRLLIENEDYFFQILFRFISSLFEVKKSKFAATNHEVYSFFSSAAIIAAKIAAIWVLNSSLLAKVDIFSRNAVIFGYSERHLKFIKSFKLTVGAEGEANECWDVKRARN